MKNFELPKLEVIAFEAEDIITASVTDFIPGENEGPFVPAS